MAPTSAPHLISDENLNGGCLFETGDEKLSEKIRFRQIRRLCSLIGASPGWLRKEAMAKDIHELVQQLGFKEVLDVGFLLLVLLSCCKKSVRPPNRYNFL